MMLKNIFLISLIAMPLTFLEVSAAGNITNSTGGGGSGPFSGFFTVTDAPQQ